MSRELSVSVLGGRASKFVSLKKPSDIIPFRGQFPLIEPYEEEKFFREIQSAENLENLSEEVREAVLKGNKIALLVEGFTEYLSEVKGLSKEEFKKLPVSKRSYILIEWMDKDHLDFKQLNIN